MKQKFILIAAILISFSAQASDFGFGVKANLQSDSTKIEDENHLHEGNIVFSLGGGFPNLSNFYFAFHSARQDFHMTGKGPYHAKFEYFISDEFGIGLVVNNSSTYGSWIYDDGIKQYNESLEYHSTAFNVRINWHFFNNNGADIFLGSGFGYKYTTYTYLSENPNGNNKLDFGSFPVGFELTIGGRYFITDMFGFYLEFGLAKSIFQGGLSIKF